MNDRQETYYQDQHMRSNANLETESQPYNNGSRQSNLPQKVNFRRNKTGKNSTKSFGFRKRPQFRGDNPNLQQGSMDRRENKIQNHLVNSITPTHEQKRPGLLPIQPEESRIQTRIDSDDKIVGEFWFSTRGPIALSGIVYVLFQHVQQSTEDLRGSKFNPNFGYAYTYICIAFQLLNTLHLLSTDTHLQTLKACFSGILVPEFLQEFTRMFGHIEVEEGFYQLKGIGGIIITYMVKAFIMIVNNTKDGSDPQNHNISQLKSNAQMMTDKTFIFNSPWFRDDIIGAAISQNVELCFSNLKIKYTDGTVHKTEVNLFRCSHTKIHALGHAAADSTISQKLIALGNLVDEDRPYDKVFELKSECNLLKIQGGFHLSQFKEHFSHAINLMSSQMYHLLANQMEMKPLYANVTGSLSQLIWRHAIKPNTLSASYHLLSEHMAYIGHHLFLDTVVFYGPRVVNSSHVDKQGTLLNIWTKRIQAGKFH